MGVITYPRPNFNSWLAKPLLKLEHGKISQNLFMHLYILTIILVKLFSTVGLGSILEFFCCVFAEYCKGCAHIHCQF